MRLSRSLSSIVFAGTLYCGALGAYAQSVARTYEANTITVSASGRFEADPDTAVLSLRLSDREHTREDSYRRVSEGAEAFRRVLRQNGIDPKTARISAFQVEPVIDWAGGKQKTIGYKVSTDIELRLKDFDKAGELITALATVPTATDQSLRYEISDETAAKQKAIEDGYRQAHAEASTLAAESHRQLGELVFASVGAAFEPAPMAMRAPMAAEAFKAAAPTQDLGQQKQTVTAQISAVFRLQ